MVLRFLFSFSFFLCLYFSLPFSYFSNPPSPKVGVVKQTETRAQKNQGPSKSTQFQRELSGLYTEATLISTELEGEGEGEGMMGTGGERGGGKFILCCTEEPEGKGDGSFFFDFFDFLLLFFLSFLP